MGLTRDQLLAAQRRRIEVEVPELGGVVILQTPTAGQWLEYQRFLGGLDEHDYAHAIRIVAITAVDAEGKQLLTDEDCRELPHTVLVRLSRAAFDLTSTKEVLAAKGESSPSR